MSGKREEPPFILSLCVSLPLNLSYIALCLLVRACRQEELHGGGVTFERGQNESRVAILCMRGKRMEDGVSERQKRGTRVPARREHGLGCVGTARSGPGLCTCSNESTCVVRACRRNLEKKNSKIGHFPNKKKRKANTWQACYSRRH